MGYDRSRMEILHVSILKEVVTFLNDSSSDKAKDLVNLRREDLIRRIRTVLELESDNSP